MKRCRTVFIPVLLIFLSGGCSTSNHTSEGSAAAATPAPSQSEQLMQGIEQDITSNRLTTPADNNAMQKLALLAKIDPHNPAIKRYREQIASRYVGLAERALEQNDYIFASIYSVKAKDINPAVDGLNKITTKIQNYQQQSISTPTPVLTPPIIDAAILKGKSSLETINLPQSDIKDRKFELRFHVDLVIEKAVKRDALLQLTSQSDADARWLSSLLKSRIRLSHPHYDLLLFVKIGPRQEPHFTLYPRTP